MSRPAPARRRPRSTLRSVAIAAGLVGVAVALLSPLIHQVASSAADAFGRPLRGDRGAPPAWSDGAVTEADGILPDGARVFDDRSGIANLDPGLLTAVRAAATNAALRGIEFTVNSGWRSSRYQDELLREAVAEYGSEAVAARWVATANTSAHVSGDAIDLGPAAATAWLSEHGAAYGLCPIYDNEPWHYELRPEAIEHGCPATYPDPTYDPRMRRY